MNWQKLFTYWSLYFLGLGAGIFWASSAPALTATVEFTEPANPAYMTAVLVSEIPGDYSQGYGQRSGPGEATVKIGGIKPDTQYYFSAYRVNPETWERSPMSEEFPRKSEIDVEQVLIELPPLPLGNTVVNITFIHENEGE